MARVLSPVPGNRLFALNSPKPEAGLFIEAFEGFEGVSEPFRFTLRLRSERAGLDLGSFLGQTLGVELATSTPGVRTFHGHVTSFRHAGTDGGLAIFEAHLGPWTDFLRHRFNCRLFQNKPLPAILRKLFEAYGPLARYELRLREAEYKPITLCAQYQESDFAFLSRLLEAYGIHYAFRFQPDGHVLVLSDDSGLAPAMPGAPSIAYNVLPGAATADTIDGWEAVQQLVPTAFATKTFDFKNPRDPLNARSQGAAPSGAVPPLERFEYAGSFGFRDFQAGAAQAGLRREEQELSRESFQGRSNCRFLTAGHCFQLRDHYLDPGLPAYFVTRVHHAGKNNLGHGQASEADYRNRFTCVPRHTPYRPPLQTPRPRIHGPQTATVVGPEGEEIYCDSFGRVRIQFHWDREGRFGDDSSCWVRVSSPMAGSRFGFVAVPRIGQEVVVEFLDGDPDRPIITGVLYNQLHLPPWELPASRTQSGILTRSSRDGDPGNANALRFEDKKGQEEVWLHAEKDQRIEVENDENHEVGRDRKKKVGHDERVEVGHDRSEQVGNDEQVEIAGTQSIQVRKHRNLTVNLTKNENVGLTSTEQVGAAKTVSVGGAYALTVGAGKNEAVGMASAEEVGAAKTTQVGTTYSITAGRAFRIQVGPASLTLNADGSVVLAGSSITFESSGPVKGLGKIIDLNP